MAVKPKWMTLAAPDAPAMLRIVRAALIVALLWIVSDRAYQTLTALLGDYDDQPLAFAAYYLGWALLAVWLFRDSMAEALERTVVLRETIALLPVLLGLWTFAAIALPLLPPISRFYAPPDPPQFMFASAWYYLPKSADILFQQALVAGLILTAAQAGLGLRAITVGLALAFGLFHLSLVFDGFTALYVMRFTVAATLFGALLPHLYLRVRGGFRWALGLHAGFYAADAALTHLLLAAPP